MQYNHGWLIWFDIRQPELESCLLTCWEKSSSVEMDLQDQTSSRWIHYHIQGFVSFKWVFTSSRVGLQWDILSCCKNGFHKAGFGHCICEKVEGTPHGYEEYLLAWWLGRRDLHEIARRVHWRPFLGMQHKGIIPWDEASPIGMVCQNACLLIVT